jgi:hypothetical protein
VLVRDARVARGPFTTALSGKSILPAARLQPPLHFVLRCGCFCTALCVTASSTGRYCAVAKFANSNAQVIEANATKGVDTWSIAPVTVRGPVTVGPTWAVNDAFTVLRRCLAPSAGLGRPRSILVRLGRPGLTRVPVVTAGRLSVAADRFATGVLRTFRKCVRRQHHARQYYQSLHEHSRERAAAADAFSESIESLSGVMASIAI